MRDALDRMGQALRRKGSKEAVIRRLLAEGIIPPTNMHWKQFCERVRDECNGWIGKGPKRKPAYGLNNRTIKDTVRRVSTFK
jgi:hypothetical protein